MTVLNVLFDERWVGSHGIGRVAAALQKRLPLTSLNINGTPVSPIDPLRFWLRVFRRGGVIVFSPGYNAPIFSIKNFVFIIHDLNHLDCKNNSTFLKRLYYSLIIKRACRFSFRVLTVSEFSRARICAWAKVSPDKVINIGNGVDDNFSLSVTPASLGYSYLFVVGNRKAHKNEKNIVEAFSASGIDASIRLVLTGPPSEELQRVARMHNVGDRLIFLGRVDEADLPGLYRGAIALLFPSLYEGFGLPVIEAMACGTPVLTSTTTALPEVAGDAALLVNPESVGEIAEGIRRLCGEEELRMILRDRGLEHCKRFRWDAVADRVRDVFQAM